MGYAQTVPYAIMEIKTHLDHQVISINNTLDYQEICAFTFPSFRGLPDYAYADVIVQGRKDTSGALNYNNVLGNTRVRVGANYYNCGLVNANSLDTPANTRVYETVVFPGSENIASYLHGGSATYFYFYIESKGNDLQLFDVYVNLRLYFYVL